MEQSTVTTGGRITLPKAIREHMGLKPGDRVRFFLRPDGDAILLSVIPVSKLRGIVKYDGPPVTIEEMDEAIVAAVIARDERSKRR